MVAAPAPPASVFNDQIPRWLKLSGEFLTRGEGRTAFGFKEGNNDANSKPLKHERRALT